MRPRVLVTVLATLGLTLAGTACDAGRPADPGPPRPTVGEPVVIDASVPGWKTSAWLADRTFCVRVFRADGKQATGRENELVFCDPAPAELAAAGSPLLPAKPQPYVAPLDPRQRDTILVGTARGPVATVSVTMFGETATATVHRLPAASGRHVGAYALWLPHSGQGRNGMTLADITSVVGRDSAGAIVAQVG
jgi:hypothetical protein